MTKQKTRKELKETIKDLGLSLIVAMIGVIAIIILFVIIPQNNLKQQLSECREQVYCSDTFRNIMSDSCVLGCIYSTKFYYDNPKIDFKESSYDCMLNCLEKAQNIQDKFSFCEVLE